MTAGDDKRSPCAETVAVLPGWWIGWYGPAGEEWELHSPWWITGERCSDGAVTMVAAVRAESVDDAFEQVRRAYDNDPGPLERRLAEPIGDGPLFASDRFPKADWMAWDEDGRTCVCPAHNDGYPASGGAS